MALAASFIPLFDAADYYKAKKNCPFIITEFITSKIQI